MTDTAVELDHEQLSVARIAPEGRQIVLAPPGSGKTEVVAALLTELADEHDLSPVDEVLALSFSRAAVGALRSRVKRAGQSLNPAVRTLDSFASRLLEELDEESWEKLTFDERIVRADRLLREGAESDDLSLVGHLVVDEVQDLVGVRAELVLTLLSKLREDAGFTVLGDPRQSVYNFQLGESGGMSSDQFLDRVRGLGDVREIRLRGQYRARTTDARAVAELAATSDTGESWLKAVRSFLADVVVVGEVEALARPMMRWAGSTAFLCRTNGEALQVSRALHEAGVAATLKSPAEESPVVAWVGEVLSRFDRQIVSRDDMLGVIEELRPGGAMDSWRLLKSAERDFRASDRLDTKKLAHRVATRDLPAELLGVEADVVVSTIHRAKGLEFDNVVIVNPDDLLPGGAVTDEAAVAYVGLTRARDRIVGATCALPAYLRKDPKTGRWVVTSFRKWDTSAFEVRGSDVESNGVGGRIDFSTLLGRPVECHLDRSRSTLDAPVYAMIVDGEIVARTTEAFGEVLARRIGNGAGRRSPWPEIGGLAVESCATAVDTTDLSTGPQLRVGVRISGMADLIWSRGDENG